MAHHDIRQTAGNSNSRVRLSYVARVGVLAMGYIFISRWLSHWLPASLARASVAFALWVGVYWIPPRPKLSLARWIELSALGAIIVYVVTLLLFTR
jgi:hypothetical protein